LAHIIVYNSKTHALESKIQGILTFNEVKGMITEIVSLAKGEKLQITVGRLH